MTTTLPPPPPPSPSQLPSPPQETLPNGEGEGEVPEGRRASVVPSPPKSSNAPSQQTLTEAPLIRSKRPKDSAFRQQRLPAWQLILTPYNVIPSLLVLALLFVPIGIVLVIFSHQVQEYRFDYTACLQDAPLDVFSTAPSGFGSAPFEWRRLRELPSYASKLSTDFSSELTPPETLCELRFVVNREISGPVFEYYRLSNYYQNQRLYVKSVDWAQLRGNAVSRAQLSDCAPLIGPDDNPVNPQTGNSIVYYPCGLIANSIFNDTISGLALRSDSNPDRAPSTVYSFPPKDIAWSYDQERYGPSKYNLGDILPPPFWLNNRKLVNANGTYKQIPDLQNDERFQNWMKVAGLPVFRKLYGKYGGSLPAGTYTVLISSTFEVSSYGASKAFVLSNTSWLGGKNTFLGYAYITTGSVFLALALAFLIRHLLSPRRLGDVRYLSWNQDGEQGAR